MATNSIIEKLLPRCKVEKQVQLKDVGVGKVFRFPGITYEEALSGKDEATFYRVVANSAKKSDDKVPLITAVSLDGKSAIERHGDHMVISHPDKQLVGEAEMVEA